MITLTIHAGYHPEAPSARIHWTFASIPAFEKAWAKALESIQEVHNEPGSAAEPQEEFL